MINCKNFFVFLLVVTLFAFSYWLLTFEYLVIERVQEDGTKSGRSFSVLGIAAANGLVFTNPDILKLKMSTGRSLARLYVSIGIPIQDIKLLSEDVLNGETLAEFQVLRGLTVPNDLKLLSMITTTGHPLVGLDAGLNKRNYSDESAQLIKLKNGGILAHLMANSNGFVDFKDINIIKATRSDAKGATVAHYMAFHKHDFKDKSILVLKNNRGISVAHVLAVCAGKLYSDPEISQLKDVNGVTVEKARTLGLRCERGYFTK